MAEKEPITPEKQLLKLIENPKQEALQGESVKREGKKWLSLGALKGRFSFWKSFSFKKWFSFKQLTKTAFGVRQINLMLKASILFLSLYLGYSVIGMETEMKHAANLILEPDKGLAIREEHGAELKNLSYYLEKAAKRNIFTIGQAPTKEGTVQAPPKPASESDRTKDFSLVGISWSANPEAMIEDTKSKRTYFVKRGQPLDDSVRIVTIFKDRVILNYKDKEFELR